MDGEADATQTLELRRHLRQCLRAASQPGGIGVDGRRLGRGGVRPRRRLRGGPPTCARCPAAERRRRKAPVRLWSPLVERVTGIGGFFFRARDPAALAAWYDERLGVKPVPQTYEQESWRQQEGDTVFAPFELGSEMIGPPEHTWMINFRVADLDAIVEQLRAAGEEVDVDPERYPNGRFAALRDPEGNGIQLWQPMGPP